MKARNDRVIVRVNLAQKNVMDVGGVEVLTATNYETNYREKAPVIAEVMIGNDKLQEGEFILTHHNHFYGTSPYHLYDEIFSIPTNHTIFAILSPCGELFPVYGNVLASKVEIETPLPVPAEYRKFHRDRGIILDGGWTDFKEGDLVFTRPDSLYEIVYIWANQERRICKINSEMICAVIKK